LLARRASRIDTSSVSIELLDNASRTLAERCVDGIRVDRERCRVYAERSLAVTTLAPVIGHDAATALVKRAQRSTRVRLALPSSSMLSSKS
jgi:aspartate ammonia-lyase